MERLTVEKINIGCLDSNKLPSYEALYERLRQYEDLGTPSELAEMKAELEQLKATELKFNLDINKIALLIAQIVDNGGCPLDVNCASNQNCHLCYEQALLK